MNRKLLLIKRSLNVTGALALVQLLSGCQVSTHEQQASDSRPAVVAQNQAFTPSHTTALKLVWQGNADEFKTPVDITYKDPAGKRWIAPAGTISDGASIPALFADLFGGRLSREFLFAAIIHDAYCAEANSKGSFYQAESWQKTHHMFYYACLDNGTSLAKASTMYAAVRLGGPRWPLHGMPFTTLQGVADSVLLGEMKKCKAWIDSKGDTLKLEHIDRWMDEREQVLLAAPH